MTSSVSSARTTVSTASRRPVIAPPPAATASSSGRAVNAAWPRPTPTATRATRIAEAAGSSATRAGRPSVGHSAASPASTAAARFRPTWRLVTGADSSPKHPHPPVGGPGHEPDGHRGEGDVGGCDHERGRRSADREGEHRDDQLGHADDAGQGRRPREAGRAQRRRRWARAAGPWPVRLLRGARRPRRTVLRLTTCGRKASHAERARRAGRLRDRRRRALR